MKTKDFEGVKVKITSGDRDWVGIECTIRYVKDDGECEVHSHCDFYRSNIKHIQTNPDEEWNTNGHEMILLEFPNETFTKDEVIFLMEWSRDKGIRDGDILWDEWMLNAFKHLKYAMNLNKISK